MSFAVLGGIFLNIGAYLTFKGRIFQAVIAYLLADICWVVMAYERDDFWGIISITVGVIFGLLAFYKMKIGVLRKTLEKEED
jgi:hypothetical protein